MQQIEQNRSYMLPIRRELITAILLIATALPLLCGGVFLAHGHIAPATATLLLTGAMGYLMARLLNRFTDGFDLALREIQRQHGSVHVHLSRMHLLQSITHAMAVRQDLASIFQVVVHSLEQDLPVDFCCICLYDSTAEMLTVDKSGRLERGTGYRDGADRAVAHPDRCGAACPAACPVCWCTSRTSRAVGYPFPQRLARAGSALGGDRAAQR